MVNNRYEPTIVRFDVDWDLIKTACMRTIGKEKGVAATKDWKRRLLLAEHSPLRRSMISVRWEEIPYFVSTHLARHHQGCEKFVSTSRADRTNVNRRERRQTDMVSMEMDMNIQALINIMRKRLCNCADKETQKYALGLLKAIAKYDEDIAWVCVPEGIRDFGCPEKFGNCHTCENILKDMTLEQAMDIQTRYDYYNEYRNKVLGKELVKCKHI